MIRHRLWSLLLAESSAIQVINVDQLSILYLFLLRSSKITYSTHCWAPYRPVSTPAQTTPNTVGAHLSVSLLISFSSTLTPTRKQLRMFERHRPWYNFTWPRAVQRASCKGLTHCGVAMYLSDASGCSERRPGRDICLESQIRMQSS